MKLKKIIKKITNFLVLFFVIFFENSIKSDKVIVYADYNCNLVNVGDLYEIIPVVNTTKVYIPYIMVPFIEGCGRTVYNEPGSGGGGLDPIFPDFPYGGSIVSPNSFVPITVKYYYYADPENPKLLSNYSTLNNDYESLTIAIQYLENIADFLGYEASDKKNAVLSYIRTINKNYEDEYLDFTEPWRIVAGPCSYSFISYVDSLNVPGMKIREYFASFVSASDYNDELHGMIDSSFLHLNYLDDGEGVIIDPPVLFVDPVSNNSKIDLIHLFASIDGICINTGERTGNFPYDYYSKNMYRHMVSWAGDLQKSAFQVSNNISSIHSFDDVINYGIECNGNHIVRSNFPVEDLYADVDAINIARNVNLSTSEDISTLIGDYFSSIIDDQTRFENFYINVGQMRQNPTNNDSINFKFVVKYFMKLNLDDTELILPYSPVHFFFENSIKKALYGFIGYPNSLMLLEDRIIISDFFIEHIESIISD